MENNVFINCSYDKSFEPTLYAIMFTCISLGLNPVLSKIDITNSIRIKNISHCIKDSIISIHDLSIMGTNENSRYNMPLEIGMAVMHNFNCDGQTTRHNIIILEPEAYLTQKCCSDLNAFDPICYKKENNFEKLIKDLSESIISIIGQKSSKEPYQIFNEYLCFQAFMYDNQLWNNSSLNSIRKHMSDFVSTNIEQENCKFVPITKEELDKILI